MNFILSILDFPGSCDGKHPKHNFIHSSIELRETILLNKLLSDLLSLYRKHGTSIGEKFEEENNFTL
jgi:hypothetical protein